MSRTTKQDKDGLLVDNKENGEEIIGGIRLVIPLNRNLSWKFFGQLHNLIHENS